MKIKGILVDVRVVEYTNFSLFDNENNRLFHLRTKEPGSVEWELGKELEVDLHVLNGFTTVRTYSTEPVVEVIDTREHMMEKVS